LADRGQDKVGLVRQLGLFDSTMIGMGIVIGSGIFLTTGIMAESIPSAGLILLAWLVGGLLTLAGALTYAELSAAMPEAGGQYVYLKKAYGPLSGFLFGWVMFLVYNSGGIAGLAAAFAEYFGYFFPELSNNSILYSADLNIFGYVHQYSLSRGQLVAAAVVIVLSLCNYFGVGFGKAIQNLFTVVKIGALLALIVLGLALGNVAAIELSATPAGLSFGQLVVGFGLAMVAVSWAFDGWNNIVFVAGEVRNPGRNLPLALILGTLGVTVLYLLVNMVYLATLPVGEMAGELRVAEKACTALFGGGAAVLISAAVVVSTFGAINGSILVGPRVYYAMARDNLFFRRVARVSPRFRTPGFSILIQAVWCALLTLSGTFEQLITFTIFAAILFWIAAAASVFALRKKYPDLPRPYKTWGYPVVPIVFIVASAGILLNTLVERPVESLAGLGLTAIGIPVYYYWRRRGGGSRDEPSRPAEENSVEK